MRKEGYQGNREKGGQDRRAQDLVKYHLGWKLALKLTEGGFIRRHWFTSGNG